MSMRKIYRKIARKNGVSVKEVKRDMQMAIEYAWMAPNKSMQTMTRQKRIADGYIPTPDELIQKAAIEVREKMSEE